MKAIRINQWAEPLKVEEITTPEPKEGEVLVRVRAASVNPLDRVIAAGWLQHMLSVPMGIGTDFAGDVVSGGTEASGLRPGDAVYGFAFAGGTFAEQVVVPESDVAKKPASLSYEAAAAVPLASLAAWQALHEHLKVQPGERLLVVGAAGAVGMFTVQFAKLHGVHVIGCASAADVDFLRELGADEVVAYETEAFEDVAADADCVYDLVGGEPLQRALAMLKPGGRLVSPLGQVTPNDLTRDDIHYVAQETLSRGDQLTHVAELIDSGKVSVIVKRAFPMEEANAAMTASMEPHKRGKIVVVIPDGNDA